MSDRILSYVSYVNFNNSSVNPDQLDFVLEDIKGQIIQSVSGKVDIRGLSLEFRPEKDRLEYKIAYKKPPLPPKVTRANRLRS